MDCKQALVESGDDIGKAVDWLRQKGLASAGKKMGRVTNEGVIASYIHAGNKIGVLVEVNCETDFVARNEEFQALVRNLTLQIAASKPSYVRREDVPKEVVEKELEIYRAQAKEMGKPPSGKLTNDNAYHTKCITCHEAAMKRDSTLKAPQACADCHVKKT